MFARLAAKIKRSPKKIKREIDKLPILKDKQNKAYQKLLQEHAPLIPKLNEEDTLILEALRKNGTCVIPSANLIGVRCFPLTIKSIREDLPNSLKLSRFQVEH